MALRTIVLEGDSCLTKVCRPVTAFNGRLHQLLDDMAETLADANGAGLAAPQVGILRRVCLVLDDCLSVPGKFAVVERPNIVRVRAQDRDGNWFEAEAQGLTARAFCHEIEHLDGHLFVEHVDHFLTEDEIEEYLKEHGEE